MKVVFQLVVVTVLTVAGILLWSYLFPSPQHIIRARLNTLAHVASFDSQQGILAGFTAAHDVGDFFSTNVEVDLNMPGNPDVTLTGRDQIVQTIMRTHATVNELKVDFPDLNITIGPDKLTATADLTIRAQIDGDGNSVAEEMKFTFQKIDGQWLITHIETVQVLT